MEEDEDRCVICLCPMSNADSHVRLRCGHVFHGQCICDHLVHDGRCPTCRDSPYGNGTDYDSEFDQSSDAGVELPRVTRNEGIALGREAAKTDKRTAAMLVTLRKCKAERAAKKRELLAVIRQLAPHEKELDRKISAYAEKAEIAFNTKHSKLLDMQKTLKREEGILRGRVSASKTRIAKKYGFIPRSRGACTWIGRDIEIEDILDE